MRKIREVLRLRYECGCKHRQIAASCQIGAGTVSDYLRRASDAGLQWEDAKGLTDAELEGRLFQQGGRWAAIERAPIDCEWVDQELRRTGVTLQLLWTEDVQAAYDAGNRRHPRALWLA